MAKKGALISKEQEQYIELLAVGYTRSAAKHEMALDDEVELSWYSLPHVKRAVTKRRAELSTLDHDLDKEALINLAKTILFADVTDMYNNDGTLKKFEDIPEGLRACINQIEFKRTEDRYGVPQVSTKVTMIDKKVSVDLLSKVLSLLNGEQGAQTEFKIGYD